jgi:hypothetical protein
MLPQQNSEHPRMHSARVWCDYVGIDWIDVAGKCVFTCAFRWNLALKG